MRFEDIEGMKYIYDITLKFILKKIVLQYRDL